MNGVTQISTKGMTRPEWLALRRRSIGGSDAAGVIGLSKWSSPMSVWADKLGYLPEKEDTEAMRVGRDLEDYVARRWMEATGKRVQRLNAMLCNEAYPFAHADIDRQVIGENAGLECKTTSALDLRKFHGVEFPEQYYVQCVHYMAVTGCERWYLGVLVLGREFFHFTLERDQAEIDALMEAEAGFWEYVKANSPPPVDGTKPTSETLQSLYPETRREEIDIFGEEEKMLWEWLELREQEQALENRLAYIENRIKDYLGVFEQGTCPSFRVSWKPRKHRSFQPAKLRQEHPEIPLDPYYKISDVRPLIIKHIEEEEI